MNNKIKNAVMWSFAAELSAKLIVPITNMILARILAPEAFGIIAIINMIISFANMLETSGISKYIVQHEFENKEELEKNADVAFWTNILLSFIMWSFIAIFSTPISVAVGNPGYEIPLIVASLSLPLTVISSIQESIFQRNLDYKALFYRRLVVSFLPFFVTIPIALIGMEYWSLIIGTLVGNIAKIVILTIYCPWRPSLFYSLKILKKMLSFGIFMILVSLSSWLTNYIDILFVNKYMGEYYTGLYCNSQVIVTGLISIITSSTSSVLFSSLSREQNDKLKFDSLFFSFQKKLGILLIPLGVGIYSFSNLITIILLGEQWLEASNFIGTWGLSTAMFCLFADYCRDAFKAKGRPELIFYVQLINLAFLTPLFYFAAKAGFQELCIVRSGSNILVISVYLYVLRVLFQISIKRMFIQLKEPIFCSILMGCLANFLLFLNKNYLIQCIYIIICIFFYFVSLLLFKDYRDIANEIFITIKNKFMFRKDEF